jgi:hypothetical protein
MGQAPVITGGYFGLRPDDIIVIHGDFEQDHPQRVAASISPAARSMVNY